jgi:hypothetical protein
MERALIFALVAAALSADTASVRAAKLRKYDNIHFPIFQGRLIYIKFVEIQRKKAAI